jgi:O-antigen ligase
MAVSTVIRRVSYVLIGASMLMIKYYPQLGVVYDPYEGIPEYAGVTTSKSQLGVICLISGLFFFWDTLVRWPERKGRRVKPLIFANIIFMGIVLRLLMLSDSKTSLGCLVIGCLVLVILHSNWAKANPRIVTASIPVVLAIYIVLVFVFDISSSVARLFGRDPTLTGRTNIWATLLAAQTNPLIGVGYQSFWMGDRMAAVYRSLHVTTFLNEAHNGYLETYLNLGLIGLGLLAVFLFSGCRSICRQLVVSPYFASFGLMFWLVSLVYNFTESAFGSSFPWMILLLCVVVVPRLDEVPSHRTEFVVKRRTTNPRRYGSRQEDGGIPSRRSVIRGGTSPSKL